MTHESMETLDNRLRQILQILAMMAINLVIETLIVRPKWLILSKDHQKLTLLYILTSSPSIYFLSNISI